MKSYIDITGKYLRGQKRRSVLTVIGIILSVALITGVGTIFTSMFDANMRVTVRQAGSYHAAVVGVPGDRAGQLASNVEVGQAGISERQGFAAYAANEHSDSDTDPPYKYLDVQGMDAGAMALLPYEIEEGRMPGAAGEIALDNWTLKYMDGAQLGGTVSLDLGERMLPDGTALTDTKTSDPNERFVKRETRTYTVVGLLKPLTIADRNFGAAITWLDAGALSAGDSCTVYMKLKSLSGIAEHVRRIVSAAGFNAAKGGDVQIAFNDRILRLYAQSLSEVMNDSVMTLFAVVVLLVIIATVAVIYNAFNISVIERVSQFGLMRCVGATPRQIRSIVFREALILGAIGIPIGIVCGTIAMGVVFNVISSIAANMIALGMGLRLVISPWFVVASALIGAFTIYLSALLPARKAGKISPMEAVRSTGAFKKEKYRKSDRYRIVLALLGAEGWMAWKNLGRNRKRFYITVFSMVISIVLFIVFSSLVQFAYQGGLVESGDVPSYMVWSSKKLDLSQQEIAALRHAQGVDYVLRRSSINGTVSLPEAKLGARALELLQNQGAPLNKDEKGDVSLVNSTVLNYGDESMDLLLKSLNIGSIDRQLFEIGEGVILLNGGTIYDNANRRFVLAEMTSLKQGDEITVTIVTGPEDNLSSVTKNLKVLAVADEGIAGNVRNETGAVSLIGSEKLYGELAPAEPFPTSLMIMMRDGADRTAIRQLLDDEIDPRYSVMDYDEMAKSQKQAWTVLSIFLYGFVSVISLIGCLNIINTISTNIILRTRELSVMRAIGMHEGNVRKMVAMESVLHGAAAALIGAVAGTALSWLIYHTMIAVREFPWTLPWTQILIAVGAAALVAVVSALIPLRRINGGVIMEGIRGEE